MARYHSITEKEARRWHMNKWCVGSKTVYAANSSSSLSLQNQSKLLRNESNLCYSLIQPRGPQGVRSVPLREESSRGHWTLLYLSSSFLEASSPDSAKMSETRSAPFLQLTFAKRAKNSRKWYLYSNVVR
jgi:hypothetical protein